MLLSEYIKSLQEHFNENGDMECLYATDETGSYFETLESDWTIQYANKTELENNMIETLLDEDDNPNEDEYQKVIVIN